MRLWATEICAEYSTSAPFLMPDHAGGMFHGLFGRALRAMACPQEDRCSLGPCARPGACDCERLFTPPAPVPLPHRLPAGMKEPPGPVVLLIPPPGGVRFSDAPKTRPLDKEGEHIGELLPVLAAGELTHVGGGTSFGLGRIEVRSWSQARIQPAASMTNRTKSDLESPTG